MDFEVQTTTTDKNGKVVRKVSNAYLKHNFMFFVILFARDYKEAMKSVLLIGICT